LFFYELEVLSWGSSRHLFFISIFDTFVMYFWHFEDFRMKQVLVLQRVLKLFFPLVDVTASFGGVANLFIIIYLFSLKRSDKLFS
jgi:hypothetical protein